MAYTLQGWLKGINSSILKPSRDMGRDGTNTSMQSKQFARDVYSATVGYYSGDYQLIGSSTDNFELDYSSSTLETEMTSLYNGNISHIVKDFARFRDENKAFVFQYDQFYRITEQENVKNPDVQNYDWSGSSSSIDHKTVHQYDHNGNVDLIARKSSGTDIDFMTYSYQSGTNKLKYVNDAFGSVFIGNFPDQDPGNYTYNAAGELIEDESATINSSTSGHIDWNAYNLVESVVRGPTLQPIQRTDYEYSPDQLRVKKYSYILQPGDNDTTVTTFYIRDPQGNVLATYSKVVERTTTFTWQEQYLYGMERFGSIKTGIKLYERKDLGTGTPHYLTNKRMPWGCKFYEQKNHLGNVMSVTNDRKVPVDDGSGGFSHFKTGILRQSDYYPFGYENPQRTYKSKEYRFGYNGKEQDDEGEFHSVTHYDYGARIYNPAVGRFLKVDPIAKDFPWVTPFNYAENEPIAHIDLWGMQQLRFGVKFGKVNNAYGLDFGALGGRVGGTAKYGSTELSGREYIWELNNGIKIENYEGAKVTGSSGGGIIGGESFISVNSKKGIKEDVDKINLAGFYLKNVGVENPSGNKSNEQYLGWELSSFMGYDFGYEASIYFEINVSLPDPPKNEDTSNSEPSAVMPRDNIPSNNIFIDTALKYELNNNEDENK